MRWEESKEYMIHETKPRRPDENIHWHISTGEICFLYIHQLCEFIIYVKQLSNVLKLQKEKEYGSLGFTEICNLKALDF